MSVMISILALNVLFHRGKKNVVLNKIKKNSMIYICSS